MSSETQKPRIPSQTFPSADAFSQTECGGLQSDDQDTHLERALTSASETLHFWVKSDFATDIEQTMKSMVIQLEEFERRTLCNVELLEAFTTFVHNERGCLRENMDQMLESLSARDIAQQRSLERKLAEYSLKRQYAEEQLAYISHVTVKLEQAYIKAALQAEKAKEEVVLFQQELAQKPVFQHTGAPTTAELKEDNTGTKALDNRKTPSKAVVVRSFKKPPQVQMNNTFSWESCTPFILPKEANMFDQGIACVVGAVSDLPLQQISCLMLSNEASQPAGDTNDELISNIIRVENLPDGHVHVAIPHCLTRQSGCSREPQIRVRTLESWRDAYTEEISLDAFKEVKFVQTTLLSPEDCVIAVVSRYKKDTFTITRQGGAFHSSVDGRVTITVDPNTFPSTKNIQLQIQPVETTLFHSIKQKNREEFFGIFSSSPIINCSWMQVEKFSRPVQVTLPCPANPARAKKIAAAREAKEQQRTNPKSGYEVFLEQEEAKRKEREEKSRLTTGGGLKAAPRWYLGSFGFEDDDENDKLVILTVDQKGRWQQEEGMRICSPRLDLITIHLPLPLSKFVVLRTKPTVDPLQMRRMAAVIDSSMSLRGVKAILRLKDGYPSQARLLITPTSKAEKARIALEDDGFTYGPDESPELFILEGQKLVLAFRGNIRHTEAESIELNYNSQLPFEINVELVERNSFQTYYRGFAQVYTLAPERAVILKGDDGKPITQNTEEKRVLLLELAVRIAKPDVVLNQLSPKTPVLTFTTQDKTTSEILLLVADELGDEWLKLAHLLNIKRTRIQAILRYTSRAKDSVKDWETAAKHEMLLTWAKRAPKVMDKVAVLCEALQLCGRSNLVDQLLHLKQETINSSRQ